MKRWWGVRHIRYYWLSWRAYSWAQDWAQMGIGLGVPNESDMRTLDAIWRGEA
jgi:hypothetical protein